MRCGWAAFTQYRSELCGWHVPDSTKLKVFESVVTPRVMYGSAAWTLTQSMESELRTTHRRMLRMMFPVKRRRISADASSNTSESSASVEGSIDNAGNELESLEPWDEFIQRATQLVKLKMRQHLTDDWVVQHKRRKWAFSGRIARSSDTRWSKAAMNWIPSDTGSRNVGRPARRWSDDLVEIAGEQWRNVASDETAWRKMEHKFVNP